MVLSGRAMCDTKEVANWLDESLYRAVEMENPNHAFREQITFNVKLFNQVASFNSYKWNDNTNVLIIVWSQEFSLHDSSIDALSNSLSD